MSDRSLDEFAAASAGSEDGGDSHADPSVPTMRWSADGAACDACGATVRRRWRDTAARRATSSRVPADDGDDFVCADCKEW